MTLANDPLTFAYMGTMYSSDCIEVLDYMFPSEGTVAEALVLSKDGLVRVGGQHRRDARKSKEKGK